MKKLKVCMVWCMVASVMSVAQASSPPEQVLSAQPGLSCTGGEPVIGVGGGLFTGRGAQPGNLDEEYFCGVHRQYVLDAAGDELRPNTLRIYWGNREPGKEIQVTCFASQTAGFNGAGGWTMLGTNVDAFSINTTNNLDATDLYIGDYEPAAQLAEHTVTVVCWGSEYAVLLHLHQLIKEWIWS